MRALILDLIEGLEGARDWVLGPPEFVDQKDVDPNAGPGDIPVLTVGGALKLYSTLPPWTLPRDVDRRHLDDVTEFLDKARAPSLHE